MDSQSSLFKRSEEEKWSKAGEKRWQLFKRLEKNNATASFFLQNEAIKVGAKVLELACGSGETTLQVAAKVRGYSIPTGETTGEVLDKLLEFLHQSNAHKTTTSSDEGSVVAVDIAKGMLEVFRKRLDSTVLKNYVQVIESDAEEFPMPEKAFDVVISQYSIPHFPNATELLKKVRLALVPNTGRLVTVIWGPVSQCDIFSIPKQFLGDPHGHHHHHHHDENGHQHDENGKESIHCHCGSPQHTLNQIKEAGFRYTTVEFPVIYEFDCATDYLHCLAEMNEPMKHYMGEPNSEKWKDVESYVKKHNSFTRSDGSGGIRLNNIAIGIIAEP
eukprot:jgi/Galph1/4147/GphlegSOOS_G2825.1